MPTRAKIPTIRRAEWMPKDARYVATDWCGQMTAFPSEPVPEVQYGNLSWFTSVSGIARSEVATNGPRTKPPADPAKTLRRIV